MGGTDKRNAAADAMAANASADACGKLAEAVGMMVSSILALNV